MSKQTVAALNLLRRIAGAVTVVAVIAGGCLSDDAPTPETAAEEHTDEHEGEDEHADESGRVELSEAAIQSAGIAVSEVGTRDVDNRQSGASVPGQVELDPARVALVSPRTAGRIERLMAVEGDRVRAGQPLALLLSPAFITAQNDFLQALRRATLLVGTDDEQGARALAEAARRRLLLIGVSRDIIERLADGGDPLDLLPIVAPFDGNIVHAHTLTGAAAEAGSPIFTLADLSVVTVVADVPEHSLSLLEEGQTADVQLSAYPNERVQGVVDRIRQELDATTRTAKAVIRVSNPRGILRPGMFASVRLSAGRTERVTLPVIPAEAVITDGAERLVFVEVAARTFEQRVVDTEAFADGLLIVRSGLAPGERVVTRGAFTLKSELGKAEFGDHGH